jgi:glycosyltransferase involved in cell wall biosynthesis
VKRVTRLCYAGTYEREYPRNVLTVAALRRAGVRVEQAHVPVFERTRDKSALKQVALAKLALQLGAAYCRLIPEVALRLLRCDGLVVGYIGQLDMLPLGLLARVMGKPVLFNPLVTLTDTLVEDRALFAAHSFTARAISRLDQLALQLATVILADTPQNATYLRERFSLDAARVAVFPVGADERVFFPAPVAAAARCGPLRILFYGTFIPLHGVPTILRAAAELGQHAVPFELELVGTGQEYGAARRLAKELSLDGLRWTDWITGAQLGERLRAADVVLGIFNGGAKAGRVIPNKVFQALACARPVVTRRSPASEWLLRDGENALLVPPDDPSALADALERLGDPALRERLGRAGHQVWVEAGSEAALARQLIPALQRLGMA